MAKHMGRTFVVRRDDSTEEGGWCNSRGTQPWWAQASFARLRLVMMRKVTALGASALALDPAPIGDDEEGLGRSLRQGKRSWFSFGNGLSRCGARDP
jgi:hypothetical protein